MSLYCIEWPLMAHSPFFLFFGRIFHLLKLGHPLNPCLVPPFEQRRGVDVWMRVVLIVRDLEQKMSILGEFLKAVCHVLIIFQYLAIYDNDKLPNSMLLK